MIHDFSIAEQVPDLNEYYKRIYKLHSDAHTPEYMKVHHEIVDKLAHCSSYTEMGVNQGATLAAAMLQDIPVIKAYDISLTPYNYARSHFDIYAECNNIDYAIVEADTLKINIEQTDMLYIDTLHTYKQLSQELELHGNKANKYIICHDTHARPELKQAINEFVARNPKWEIITDCTDSVGFTTLRAK